MNDRTNTVAAVESASKPTLTMNRWMVVVGAVLIQMCLGAIYAWSVFTPKLLAAPFSFSKTQTQIIFSVGLAAFAIMTIVGGRWQAKVGPTTVVRVGGLVLAIGYILGGLAERLVPGSVFYGMLVGIGLIGGAGIGLAYVVPIAAGVKWFPDKKGLITGLAVAGFGFGALIWIYLGQGFAGWTGLLASLGVSTVFMLYGLVFFVLVMLGSVWMKNPPEGFKPAGWTGAGPAAGRGAVAAAAFESGEMLATPQFYMLWIMFSFGAMAGLMVIGIIKLFGIDALRAKSGLTALEASAIAGTAMAVFYAIANGLGRIVWGIVSDKIGRKPSLALMLAAQGVVMLLFFYMGGTRGLLYLGAALIGFNFGGNFALFPAATADFFGNKNVGKNYGWVFTSYGVGGIAGPIMAGLFTDAGKKAVEGAANPAAALAAALNAWHPAFIIAGIACLFAAVLALLLRAPKKAAA